MEDLRLLFRYGKAMNVVHLIIKAIVLTISLFTLWINIRLYEGWGDRRQQMKGIHEQLCFLEDQLKMHDQGNHMQQLFPEGFVFIYSLYGLSWCEFGMADTLKVHRKKAVEEAYFAWQQINSTCGRQGFNYDLQPRYGIFYTGWNNYLLSKLFLLDESFSGSDSCKRIFADQCEAIAQGLRERNSPYLPSYSNACWPADMCVAMASLSNHDRMFESRYQGLISNWIYRVKQLCDAETKLIPHEVNATTAATIMGARGSSSSLIIRLMAEIDMSFAKELYASYLQHFVGYTLALPSVREFPKGRSGKADIDSGPVILGVGFAATLVAIGTFAAMGDADLARQQYQTVNAFGFGWSASGYRQYLFGQLPIADAFIVWSRTAALSRPEALANATSWRFRFHLISMSIIFILNWLTYLRLGFGGNRFINGM